MVEALVIEPEILLRQAQHRGAEISALLDVPEFIERAHDIYDYPHVICDSGGSLCEVVDVDDASDPVLTTLAAHTVMVYIAGHDAHTKMLVERFRRQPKPMYYQPVFLDAKWAEYKSLNGITSKRANVLLGLTGKTFWQDESYDRLIRNQSEFNRIVNYIEENPVRAGLVADRSAFRWSSAWATGGSPADQGVRPTTVI